MIGLIRQVVETVAKLINSKPTTLLSIKDQVKATIIGGWLKNEFIAYDKEIPIKNTPLEKIILSKEARTYPGKVIESLPFPNYKDSDKKSNFSCLCLPLLSSEQQIKGILIVAQKRGSPIPTEQLETLNTILPLIASILENNLEHERLVQLATTDDLTKLYTRSYFETRLQEEFTRVRRHGGVFSLLMIDVDSFKRVNDLYGYKEGNKALQEIAKIVDSSIRKEIDIPCRYSGSQFMLLLPNTDVDGAYILAERIRQRCEKNKVTTKKGATIRVTVSIGLTHNVEIAHEDLVDDDSVNQELNSVKEVSKEEVIQRADLMLHAAKKAGRNQVMVWW
ncbi:MAG: GGDEF domain-containing protein [Candidatus Marithrix sp.]|nr:GGDEF domain-containing protein [Candidatus Marithrix sp.]